MRKILSYFLTIGGLLLLSRCASPSEDTAEVAVIIDSAYSADTARLNRLLQQGEALSIVRMGYWDSIYDEAKMLGFTKMEALALNNVGFVNYSEGKIGDALVCFKRSLEINEKVGNKRGMVESLNNVASVYRNQGNIPLSLEYDFKSLKLGEELRDTIGISRSLNNIGFLYFKQGNVIKALDFMERGLALREIIGKKEDIANSLTNLGIVYEDQLDSAKAMSCFERSLSLQEEIGDKDGAAWSLSNIGAIYEARRQYDLALRCYLQSLDIHKNGGTKQGMATSLNYVANAYILSGNSALARIYIDSALIASRELGFSELIQNAEETFYRIELADGNRSEALKHFEQYVIFRDSIASAVNREASIRSQLNYEFESKEALAKEEQIKKDVAAQKEIDQQKLVRNGFIGGFGIMVLFASIFFVQRNKIKKSKLISEELLLNILPGEVAEELKKKGHADAKLMQHVTVLFTDFMGFTQISEQLSPKELVDEIHACFSKFDTIMQEHGVEKIKTIGDAYMAAGGLPTANTTHADDVINAALAIQQFMKLHNEKRRISGEPVFEVRIGVHTGPVVAGIVGIKKFAYDIWGDTVNTASRMESSGEVGKVNVSGTTYELVKDNFHCVYRGKVAAKNKGEIDMYFVERRN